MIPLTLTLVFAAFVIRAELSILATRYREETAAVERFFGHAALVFAGERRREVPLRDTVRHRVRPLPIIR